MQENHEVESEKKNWLKINVPTSALIRKYDNHSFLRMPTSHEEYGGYTYNMFNSRIKQGRMITDLQSDSRELCLELIVEENEQIILRNGDKEKRHITSCDMPPVLFCRITCVMSLIT